MEEDDLLERVRVLSGPLAERELREEIERNRKRGHKKRIAEILEHYWGRMCDFSVSVSLSRYGDYELRLARFSKSFGEQSIATVTSEQVARYLSTF